MTTSHLYSGVHHYRLYTQNIKIRSVYTMQDLITGGIFIKINTQDINKKLTT